MQDALVDYFGHIVNPPDRRRQPEWVLVHGVIGAQTRTAASNASTDGLLGMYGSWEAVAEVPVEELEARLKRQTFPAVAAQRLSDCLGAIIARRGSVNISHVGCLDTETAMQWLETLPGVGRKISAGVLNASTLDRRAMVIDSHHGRIMQRIGLVPPKADAARTYDALVPVIPEDWSATEMDEHHLLLKQLGQTHCRPIAPDCAGCPVNDICDTGTTRPR
jgi:endonuclease-3